MSTVDLRSREIDLLVVAFVAFPVVVAVAAVCAYFAAAAIANKLMGESATCTAFAST